MWDPKTVAVCAALSAGCWVAGVGCHQDRPLVTDDSSAMPDTAGLSKEELASQGNLMIQKGQSMKGQAMQMGAGDTRGGLSRDEQLQKADEMIKNGQAMRDQGMGM